MKKIVIIGSTLSGNKGAAAMLESSMQTIGEYYPDARFTLLSYIPPSQERAKNTYKNLQILRATPLYLGLVINSLALFYRLLPPLRPLIKKNKQIKELTEADVLLDQGGITFVDGREKFLVFNVATVLPALMVGTKVVKCAQASGPYKNPINRMVAKTILPRMHTIVARGGITYKNLMTLKLDNVVFGADYAFLLKLSKEEKVSAEKHYDKDFYKGVKVVGISPSVVMNKKAEKAGKDYTNIISKFINILIEEGYRVALIPHSVRLNTEKTHNNDLPLCRSIYAEISEKEKCMFVDDELTSQELRSVIGRCDLFIASRFHAMISSLAMQVPTLVIGWSHKYREVLEMFELEEWAFGLDKLSSDYLLQRFNDLNNDQSNIRKKLAYHMPEVNEKSQKQVEVILSILKAKD